MRNIARSFWSAHTTVNRIRKRRLGLVIIVALLLPATAVAVARADVAPASTPTTQTTADAGAKNIVQAINNQSGTLRVASRIQLGRVPAPQVGPVNFAEAINTCSQSCDTLAVALQINMVNENAPAITPQNGSVAVNAGCNGCHAVALAIQYNIGSTDPQQVPSEVNRLVAAMKAELARIDATSTNLADAETAILGVLGQFQELSTYLQVRRDEAIAPQVPQDQGTMPADSPAPTPPAAPPASPDPVSSPSPDPSASPSPPPGSSPSPSPSP